MDLASIANQVGTHVSSVFGVRLEDTTIPIAVGMLVIPAVFVTFRWAKAALFG